VFYFYKVITISVTRTGYLNSHHMSFLLILYANLKLG